MKQFFLAWPCIFVVWMFGSFLVHGLTLSSDYAKLPTLFRTEEDSAKYGYLMLLAHVSMSGALVWLYSRGVEAKPWVGQGLRFGLAVAFLAAVPTYTIYFVVQPMPAELALKQIGLEVPTCLVVGLAVAFLYRKYPRGSAKS